MASSKSKPIIPTPVIAIDEDIKAGLKSHLNVLTVMNRILTKGANILYSRYLSSKNPKHLADYYFGALTELVTQEVRAYDPGESVDSMIFNWAEDEEPVIGYFTIWSVDFFFREQRSLIHGQDIALMSRNRHHKPLLLQKAFQVLCQFLILSKAGLVHHKQGKDSQV